MEETATVVEISGNKLKLSFTSQALCKKCGAFQKAEDCNFYLELENTVGANVGDKVLVKIEPSNLKISAILYGIPSAMFIIGIFFGYFLYNSEISGFFTGILFLLASFIPIKFIVKKCEPKIEKII